MNGDGKELPGPRPRLVPLWQFFNEHVEAPGHSTWGRYDTLNAGDRKAADFFIGVLRGSGRVLDIGCGAGMPALYLSPHAQSVIGIDAAPNMVEAARRNASALGLCNVGFEVMDSQELPFSASAFDGVSLCGTLMSMDRAGALVSLREARRVLKAIGRLAILECDWAAVTPSCKAEARRGHTGIVARLVERLSNPPLERDTWYLLKEDSPSASKLAARLGQRVRMTIALAELESAINDAADAWCYESTGFDEAGLLASLHEAGFRSVRFRREMIWNSPILLVMASTRGSL
jgi:ubiquinone/menaquinone biosynthesis C-methylase UbiE